MNTTFEPPRDLDFTKESSLHFTRQKTMSSSRAAGQQDRMKLIAIYDFNPDQMTSGNRNELEQILMDRRMVDFSYSEPLSFKIEEELEIIYPSIIDFKVRWWKVRHLKSGQNGFVPERRVFVKSKAEGTLMGIHDFDPENMTYSDRIELENVLKSPRYVEFMRAEKEREVLAELSVSGQSQGRQREFKESKIGKSGKRENGGEISSIGEFCHDNKLMKFENKERNLGEKALTDREINGLVEVTKNSIELLNEEASGELKSTEQKDPGPVYDKPTALRSEEPDLEADFTTTYNLELDAQTLAFKRKDTFETVHPQEIGENVGWWMVRHLSSGQVGFILKNCAVIVKVPENDQQASTTALSDLPLELMDIILGNSLLRLIVNSSSKQKLKDVIQCMASVDVCWFCRIIEKPRLRNRILPRIKDFYKSATRRSAIIGNNRNFLSQHIDPSEELLASLLTLNCITDDQTQLIRRQRTNQDKSIKLLYLLSHFNQTESSNFVKCLRRTNQKTVARILENGGVVIKVKVQNEGITSVFAQLLHQEVQDLQNKTKPRSFQTEKLISQLNLEDIEILTSQLKSSTVVVWIWCRSQAALDYMKRLHDSGQLSDLLCDLARVKPSTSQVVPLMAIKVDCNQFKKTAVAFQSSFSLTERIDPGKYEWVRGVTKLRSEIYVLCGQYNYYPNTPFIYVYEDKKPFRLQRKINVTETVNPEGIASNEKDNCLFVFVLHFACVWKITREADGQHKITKWPLGDDDKSAGWSALNDGRLLLFCCQSNCLMIYGSDAELIRSIPLSTDLGTPCHAMETSTGNFVILHDSSRNNTIKDEVAKNNEEFAEETADKDESGSSTKKPIEQREIQSKKVEERGRSEEYGWCISELTIDGKMVRRFIPSNEMQKLNQPDFIFVDSDDQVFVADRYNHRVILLDSDLRWNRIVCDTKGEDRGYDVEDHIFMPQTLYYDEEKRQLIVGSYVGGAIIYTLCRI